MSVFCKDFPELFHGLFQSFKKMEDILKGCEGVVVYQDDNLIFGSNMQEHDRRVENVFKNLTVHGLQLNHQKCIYRQASAKFLKHMFDKQGIKPDTDKITYIRDVAQPTDALSLRCFLGLVNHMQPYVPNLSELASHLNCLLKKDTQWY